VLGPDLGLGVLLWKAPSFSPIAKLPQCCLHLPWSPSVSAVLLYTCPEGLRWQCLTALCLLPPMSNLALSHGPQTPTSLFFCCMSFFFCLFVGLCNFIS
jgi:hypothetical protein